LHAGADGEPSDRILRQLERGLRLHDEATSQRACRERTSAKLPHPSPTLTADLHRLDQDFDFDVALDVSLDGDDDLNVDLATLTLRSSP
jgi:hypothetical protein